MISKEKAQMFAKRAARQIREKLSPDKDPSVALVLGTGWGNSLKLENERSLSFCNTPGYDDPGPLQGHDRVIACGDVAGKRVIALRGRVHLNEHPMSETVYKLVRLQIQMLCELGVKTFILTNAVGGLDDTVSVGDIVVASGFVTLFAPAMPLFAGEFVSPEELIMPGLNDAALNAAPAGLTAQTGGYAMIRGPFFEGRIFDKAFLRSSGAKVVGMSLLPEACVIALYSDTRALCLCLVTDAVHEVTSHETNMARAAEKSELLGAYLQQIIASLV